MLQNICALPTSEKSIGSVPRATGVELVAGAHRLFPDQLDGVLLVSIAIVWQRLPQMRREQIPAPGCARFPRSLPDCLSQLHQEDRCRLSLQDP